MTALLLALWAAAVPARAQPADWTRSDPAARAAEKELARARSQLQVEDARPYYIAYRLLDQRRVIVETSLGALRSDLVERRRLAGADVRVGSAAFDNTHFIGADGGGQSPFTIALPFEDGPAGVRNALWWLTDTAFKSALQRYSQKDAFRHAKSSAEVLPDMTAAPVVSRDLSAPAPSLPLEEAVELARRASSAFKATPQLHEGRAAVYAFEDTVRFLDSEGRRARKDAPRYEVFLAAWGQAPDGMPVSEERRLFARRPQDLPRAAELEAQARGLASDVAALVAAPRLERPYIGPVLLEDEAAGEFFNQLLARGVAATRELWLENEGLREAYRPGRLAGRFGLRVVSPLLSAFDDPAAASFEGAPLFGHYELDDEGVPARRVELVRDGALVDVPLGRTPTKDRSGSNGHARSTLEHLPSARTSCLFVAASSGTPRAELRRELLRRAAAEGLPFAVVVRRLGEEDEVHPGALLASPVVAFKVYPGGREELFRGARFAGATMRALRDVVAASAERRVYNLAQRGPYGAADDDVPAAIVHPDVVVGEMELVPDERQPDRPPYLPSPLAARTIAGAERRRRP